MMCPHCSSLETTTLKERTGTPFNYLEYTTDVVLLIVRWRVRFKGVLQLIETAVNVANHKIPAASVLCKTL